MRVRKWITLGMTLCGLAALAGLAQADDRKPYTMADLRALAQQQSWSELIDHLEDISPASRDAEWRGLGQQAALGALNMADQSGPINGLYLSEGLLQRYPALKESRDFMSKRADLGTQAFARCFAKPYWESCGERIKPFILADPTNADLGFRLGKMLPLRAKRWQAVPAFFVAIQKKDDPRCQDADVSRAVVSGLHLSRLANEDVVNESVQLASSMCWNALHAAVRDGMGDDSDDYLKNTCAFVKSREPLPPLLTKRCEAAIQKTN
jgi:hypothetical protein